MLFCYCGQEGEKGIIQKKKKKFVQSSEVKGVQGQKAKPQRCIKDTCKEKGQHTRGRGAQRWWFQLCKGEEFVYEGRKKESSLLME